MRKTPRVLIVDPVRIEAVKYGWTRSPWYTKITESTGRIIHWGPWNSRWAAQKLADLLAANHRRYE